MATYRLPVSGLRVVVQQPTGVEDLLLQEAKDLDIAVAFQLFDRLVRISPEGALSWPQLPVTDLETLLFFLRREVLGDALRAETQCVENGCQARVDVSFAIGEYLATQEPHIPRGIENVSAGRTFRVAQSGVTFRLPNGEDLLAITENSISECELVKRCITPSNIAARTRRRVERAMQAIAPRLSRTMSGECPECRRTMSFYFDVVQFVLRELCDHAAAIFEDVHLLAAYYKWPEEDILALPRSRRLRYSASLRSHSSAA